MNKRELVFAAFDNKETERVPVGFWYHFVPEGLFVDTPENLERNIQGHQKFFDEFRPDFMKLMSDGYFIYTNPTIAGVRRVEDLKNIRAGCSQEWIDKQLALARELTGRFGGEVATFCNVFAPAIYLKWRLDRQGVSLSQLYTENPAAVREALHEVAKDICTLARAVIREGGADGIYMSVKNMEGLDLTKEEYLTYIAPSELAVLEAANEESPYNILHVCSYKGTKNELRHYTEYPVKVVNWASVSDGISLEEGKELFGGKAVIGGFAKTRDDLLFKGGKEEIQEYTRELLRRTGTRGIILGADCTVPDDISLEHLEWVREAAKEFGR